MYVSPGFGFSHIPFPRPSVWSDNTLRSISSVRLSAKPLSHCIFLFHSPLCCLSLRTLWLLAVLLSLSRISDLVYSNASTGLRVLWAICWLFVCHPKPEFSVVGIFTLEGAGIPGRPGDLPQGRAEQAIDRRICLHRLSQEGPSVWPALATWQALWSLSLEAVDTAPSVHGQLPRFVLLSPKAVRK